MDKSIPATNNLSFKTIADPFDDFVERELLPYTVLESLSPKYEEMCHLLNSFPEPIKQSLLGDALFSAINSDNPKEAMDKKLTEYRKSKNIKMMLNDLASFCGQNEEYIKELLRLKFKQNDYRQFNK